MLIIDIKSNNVTFFWHLIIKLITYHYLSKMNSKHHYNTHKLTLQKPVKKSPFFSDDGESTTPLTN